MLSLLPPRGSRLRQELTRAMQADLTYADVGATAGELPGGYRHLRRETVLGSGAEVFGRAADALLHWRMHRAAGLRGDATSTAAERGTTLVQAVRVGPVWTTAPCRVVWAAREPQRVAFAYGSLPGHPESGEEAFAVEHGSDGVVRFRVVAFTVPGTLLVAALGPVAALLQARAVDRYLAALRRLAINPEGPAGGADR